MSRCFFISLDFYDKETFTLVEIPKFLKEKYESDTSRLAQWLRVFDGLLADCHD